MPDALTWEHPVLGTVHPMQPRWQVVKGWKHFYSQREHWEQLTGQPLDTLLSQAQANGCPAWSEHRKPECQSCKRCLRRHHDGYWRVAYGGELMTTEERWIGTSRRGSRPKVLATPRGVWLVLDKDSSDRVFNAYRPRPRPRHGDSDWDVQDFVRSSRHRFRQETGMSVYRREDLQHSLQRPADAWHLALAVGEARAVGDPEEREAVARAEARLAQLDDAVRHQIVPRTEALRSQLLDALSLVEETEDADAVACAMIAVEDALVAAEALGLTDKARSIATSLQDVVTGVPSAHLTSVWSEVLPLIEARAVETKGAAQGWWRQLLSTAHGASEAARLESLLTVVDAATRAAFSVLRQAGEAIVTWASPADLGWRVAPAALNAPIGAWEVTAESQFAHTAQVFAVDPQYPSGERLSEDLAEPGPFWELRADGATYFVVVDGVPRSASLAAAVEHAASTPGAQVRLVAAFLP